MITAGLLLSGWSPTAGGQGVSYTQVTLSPGESYQTMAGFGASLAFYEGWLTAHPKKADIYNVIFKELSLDILRVRNAYKYDDAMIGRVKEFNQAAQKSLGHPIDIMVTSWGPPAYLKSNNDRNNGGTLKYTVSGGKVNFDYAGFARWWNQSLDDYNKNGIYPAYISIQNEPDWKATYESCLFKPAETVNATDTLAGYNKALDAVYDTLQKRSRIPRLLGPETIGIGYNAVENYMNALNKNKLYGIAHHLYHGANETDPYSSSEFAKVGRYRPEMPHFQTEYSRGEWFPLAGMIYKSLNDENGVAYLFWDLIWDNGGLVDLDFPWDVNRWTDKTKGYQRTKHFWVFKQFSAWIHPGWKRIKVNTPSTPVKTVAFISAAGDSATLVAINTSSTATYGMKLAVAGYAIDELLLTRTSADENGISDPLPADSILLKPRSITTMAMKISPASSAGSARMNGDSGSCVVFPNPFRGAATLRFTAQREGDYFLEVYDLTGRKQASRSPGFFTPGEHTVAFPGETFKAGSYFLRILHNGRETARGKFTVAD